MKKTLGFIVIFIILMFCACAPRQIVPPEWKYEEDAIKLYVNSDSQVNLYDGEPHALHVCVYQLRDPNIFNQLAETPDGISELLQCQLINPSIVNAKVLARLGIQPAKVLTFTLDRAEGARYLGIVAGYQILEKDRTVRLFKIPVITEKKGWFGRTRIKKPGLLQVELYLGALQIKKAEIISEEQ